MGDRPARSHHFHLGPRAGNGGAPKHGTQFATYVGWLCPWNAPLALIGAGREQVERAQRDIVLIGIDELRGASTNGIDTLLGQAAPGFYPQSSPSPGWPPRSAMRTGSSSMCGNAASGHRGHVTGAVHLPVHEVVQRRSEVSAGQMWVHCGSGYRSSIAASLLTCTGRDVVLIAADAGLSLSREWPHGERDARLQRWLSNRRTERT